jgi:hypothetical protein
MKKLVLITLLLTTAVNTANAETLNDGHPKRGYNYKKHYRQRAVRAFFVRVFNLDSCHGKLNVH